MSFIYILGNWDPEKPIISLSGDTRVENMFVRLPNSYHYSRVHSVEIRKVKEYPTDVEKPKKTLCQENGAC